MKFVEIQKIKENVASRKNLGTNAGLVLRNYNQKECEKLYGNNYYILKCDISKFFASIDHDILKIKLRKKIKDEEALKIVFSIIVCKKSSPFRILNLFI